MSYLHPRPVERQRNVDSGLHRALGLALQQIHTILDDHREGVPGLDLRLLSVRCGMLA
jgi:hypothetical protein